MLYFEKQNIVLFATPKTASTSLEAALAPLADVVLQGDPRIKHCTFHRYKWRFEKFLMIFTRTPPETVALIREPEDWLNSWFRFRHGDWLNDTPRSTRGKSFDEFVDAYLTDPKPAFAAVGSQAAFLTHPMRDDQVQTLFRYDAMPEFLAWLQDRLGCTLDLPQKNVSPQMESSLSDGMRRRLVEGCARDYALYENARRTA
ncbi:gamma-glutamyl kinase [Roseinatronobacter alkalisoli]|uniref:Gamma-glutamyl kinase n=1 Tax=Roseinatronobacter alkalisoli TaxID=3028235 RepID=A0ABT5T5L8_9RHOB|nr:gamma-glutamyl kinase [Roseinatronobacter sp. HJB301]MDD7970409.1 gamma-glutamyl kinase [Roseinatronobacter sp. HJB301]